MKPITAFINQVIPGDCLEVMAEMPDQCIDLILCDLPYGITHNSWDNVISLEKLWQHYRRLIKPDGVIILTGQGIFTAKLILSNTPWFRYKIVWIKSKATNFLNAKKQPLRKHEDLCVFAPGAGIYNPQMIPGKPYERPLRICLSENYNGFAPHHAKNPSGLRYPTDVIFYAESSPDDFVYIKTAETEGQVFHATQKPVALGRYLIRTYSKPGALVLDNACGAGSFLVAAELEARRYIGIEKNQHRPRLTKKPIDLIAICKNRLSDTSNSLILNQTIKNHENNNFNPETGTSA